MIATPIFVIVNWSESHDFHENELLKFFDFEERCLKIVLDSPHLNGCYYKTSVTVLFDNGETYQCRLDLNENCCGFENHIKSNMKWSSIPDNQRLICDKWRALMAFWETISFMQKEEA